MNLRKKYLFKSVVLAVFFICLLKNSVLGQNAESGDVAQFDTVDTAIKTYKEALEDFFQGIPDNVQDPNDSLKDLSLLKSKVYAYLSWGAINANDQLEALYPGRKGGCWVLIYQKGHPVLRERGFTYLTKKINRNIHITIRPDLISKRWAAIFMIHEFTHVYIVMHNIDISAIGSEYVASKNEKTAYNHLTDGEFDGVLDDIIDTNGFSENEDLFGIIDSGFSGLIRLLSMIDAAMSEKKPLSKVEREYRFAFYILSLSIRISEINGEDTETRINNFRKLEQKLHMH